MKFDLNIAISVFVMILAVDVIVLGSQIGELYTALLVALGNMMLGVGLGLFARAIRSRA